MTAWRHSKKRLAELEALAEVVHLHWQDLDNLILKPQRGDIWEAERRRTAKLYGELTNEIENARLAVWRRQRESQKPS